MKLPPKRGSRYSKKPHRIFRPTELCSLPRAHLRHLGGQSRDLRTQGGHRTRERASLAREFRRAAHGARPFCAARASRMSAAVPRCMVRPPAARSMACRATPRSRWARRMPRARMTARTAACSSWVRTTDGSVCLGRVASDCIPHGYTWPGRCSPSGTNGGRRFTSGAPRRLFGALQQTPPRCEWLCLRRVQRLVEGCERPSSSEDRASHPSLRAARRKPPATNSFRG